jgi:hypothetical protein
MKAINKFINERNSELEDIVLDMNEWWNNHINPDGYDSNREYREDMEAMADEANDPLVDMALDALVSEYDWDEHLIEKNREDLIIVLKQWAEDALEDL